VERYEAATYGDRIAPIYDLLYPPVPDAEEAAAALAALAGGRPVLELGIGTGRMALPLVALGVEVHGIDVSAAMLEQLRRKPGGAAIPVVVGDFTDMPPGGAYGVVFEAFNTLFALPDQDAQLRCLQSVAERLEPGGWNRAGPSSSRPSCPTRAATTAASARPPPCWPVTGCCSTARCTTPSSRRCAWSKP
jgi:SAM-dependent methyltransferase